MAGEGVLQWIDDTELQHWASAAAVRAAVAAVAAAQPAVQQFQEGGSASSRPAPFQVCGGEAGVGPACGQRWVHALVVVLWAPRNAFSGGRLNSLFVPLALQCRTELGVLPADHPQRTDTLLRR